jgi:hypothetical protein
MDTFNQPYDVSREQEGTAVAADRRRSERILQHLPAWVGGESSDRAARGRNVVVHDLSLGGVGFHDPAGTYRPGATHWLIVNGGPMRLSTRMRIITCRENPEGGYDVGAAFF